MRHKGGCCLLCHQRDNVLGRGRKGCHDHILGGHGRRCGRRGAKLHGKHGFVSLTLGAVAAVPCKECVGGSVHLRDNAHGHALSVCNALLFEPAQGVGIQLKAVGAVALQLGGAQHRQRYRVGGAENHHEGGAGERAQLALANQFHQPGAGIGNVQAITLEAGEGERAAQDRRTARDVAQRNPDG